MMLVTLCSSHLLRQYLRDTCHAMPWFTKSTIVLLFRKLLSQNHTPPSAGLSITSSSTIDCHTAPVLPQSPWWQVKIQPRPSGPSSLLVFQYGESGAHTQEPHSLAKSGNKLDLASWGKILLFTVLNRVLKYQIAASTQRQTVWSVGSHSYYEDLYQKSNSLYCSPRFSPYIVLYFEIRLWSWRRAGHKQVWATVVGYGLLVWVEEKFSLIVRCIYFGCLKLNLNKSNKVNPK